MWPPKSENFQDNKIKQSEVQVRHMVKVICQHNLNIEIYSWLLLGYWNKLANDFI